MIHFTCDGCHRRIVPDEETRYVVRVEVYAAIEGESQDADEEDHLDEIEDLLERMDDEDNLEESETALYQQVRFDLCHECRERFLNDPLGRGAVSRLGFSKN